MTDLISFSVVRIDTKLIITLASEMVNPMLLADRIRNAGRVARRRMAWVPPYALRAYSVCDHCVW